MVKKKRWKLLSLALLITLVLNLSSVYAQEEEEEEQKVIIETREEVARAGTYFVRVATENEQGQMITELVRLNVMFPRTLLNTRNAEGIDAHDIVVLPNTIYTLRPNDLIEKGGAHAWDTNTGIEVPVSKTDLKKATKSGAISDVKYATDKGTDVTTSIYEQSEIHMDLDEKYIDLSPQLYNKKSMITAFMLGLILVPILLYIVIISYITYTNKNIRNFLYDKK